MSVTQFDPAGLYKQFMDVDLNPDVCKRSNVVALHRALWPQIQAVLSLKADDRKALVVAVQKLPDYGFKKALLRTKLIEYHDCILRCIDEDLSGVSEFVKKEALLGLAIYGLYGGSDDFMSEHSKMTATELPQRVAVGLKAAAALPKPAERTNV